MFISKQICPIKARKDILAFIIAIEQEGQLFTPSTRYRNAVALGFISNLPLSVINHKVYYDLKNIINHNKGFYYCETYLQIPYEGVTLFTDLHNAQMFLEDETSFCIKHNITPFVHKILRCYIPKNTLYFKSADGKRYRPEKLIVEKIVDIPTK